MGKKILIISYYWPPSGGVGVQRWMNFAIQLKKRGHEPIVLTPENPQFSVMDEGLLEKVSDIRVYKAPIWEPFDLFHKITGGKEKEQVKQGLALEKEEKSFFDHLIIWIRGNVFIPDPRVFWVRSAAKKAEEIIRQEGVDTVITTGPPHSVHLIGKKVRKTTDVLWVADFRDPWSRWDLLKNLKAGALAMFLHRYLEQSVVKSADIAISVSKHMAKTFGEGLHVLTNGVAKAEISEAPAPQDKFVMGYFGMLNDIRNATQLWLVLDQMCREDASFREKFELRIGGIVADTVKAEIGALECLKDKVVFFDYLPHERVLEEYKSCNILLLLQNKSDNSKWILPFKFFEYLMANRMILALGPRDSDLNDIIKGKEVGEVLEYHDVIPIRAFITNCFEEGAVPNHKDLNELVHSFSYESLTGHLLEIISNGNG